MKCAVKPFSDSSSDTDFSSFWMSKSDSSSPESFASFRFTVMKDGKITINKSGAVYTYQYQDGKITLEETTGGNMVFQKASESK